MNRISEEELARICDGIRDDREVILRHNPIGTPDETMLWMLLNILVSYLSLSEVETPCFTGMPTVETYRQAIAFVLQDRTEGTFDAESYVDGLIGL